MHLEHKYVLCVYIFNLEYESVLIPDSKSSDKNLITFWQSNKSDKILVLSAFCLIKHKNACRLDGRASGR